jgi:hypothetical protein
MHGGTEQLNYRLENTCNEIQYYLVLSLSVLPVDIAVPSTSFTIIFRLFALLFTDFAGSALNGFTILIQHKINCQKTVLKWKK